MFKWKISFNDENVSSTYLNKNKVFNYLIKRGQWQ